METKPQTAIDIIKSLETRFITSKAPEIEIVYHFELEGENGGNFTVIVTETTCKISEGLNGTPKCVIKAKASDYEDLELGRSNPQMALMMGKIKVSNIGSMLKFIEMFEKLH